MLSSYGAEPLLGRGTRVFEAFELDGNGKHVVLKDMWIDSNLMREGNILESLREAADKDDNELLKKYFLTTVAHGDVWTERNILDDTANGLMRGLKIDWGRVFTLQRARVFRARPSGQTSEVYREFSRARALRLGPRYEPKTHYRIVFEEVCTPLELIPKLSDVMTILTETVSGAF
jgi:hypothetical protein